MTVKVEKVNPAVRVMFYDTRSNCAARATRSPAVRFTIQPNGDVTDVNQLPKRLFGEG